jgi:hypothetical protein
MAANLQFGLDPPGTWYKGDDEGVVLRVGTEVTKGGGE